MTSGIYTQEFEEICTTCYLPDCIEFGKGARNVCPLRIVKRLKLTAQQGKSLSEIARIRQYRPELFLRMAEIQAEWNLIPVGGG
jgi:hypothetical protein